MRAVAALVALAGIVAGAIPAAAQERGAVPRDGAAWQPAPLDDARSAAGWIGAAVAATRRLELDGSVLRDIDVGDGCGIAGARVDARVLLVRPSARAPVAVSIGGGYEADAQLQRAATTSLDVAASFGRLSLTIDARAAHYFHPGRDPIDLSVTAGAMVRATRVLRVGIEYVGEDLEGLFAGDDDNAPGGRHYVGPTAALLLLRGHLRVSATGGALLTPGRQGPLVRAALAWIE
jgi:hypothetical protein